MFVFEIKRCENTMLRNAKVLPIAQRAGKTVVTRGVHNNWHGLCGAGAELDRKIRAVDAEAPLETPLYVHFGHAVGVAALSTIGTETKIKSGAR